MKTTNDLLKQLFLEKNTATQTQYIYTRSAAFFEKHTQKTIGELITIAKKEEKTPEILWGESTLRNNLVSFRNAIFNNFEFKESTAAMYFSKIPTIFRHYGVTVGELPSFSTKQTLKSEIIYPEDLPDREILKKCIEVKNPLLKAATLLMSSTGLSRVDTLKLTVKDYLNATNEYHNSMNNPLKAIEELESSEVDVIPCFKSTRRKTGISYVTFASPECVSAMNNYLLTRENLNLNDKLFDISLVHFNKHFRDVNNLLGLGKVNGVSRFTPQMLRRYHASQLYEAGMSADKIDLLEGRAPKGIIHQSYIRIKTKTLKEEYIRCLPFLVVTEIEKARTEIEVLKEENKEYKESLEEMWEEINNIKEREKIWENIK